MKKYSHSRKSCAKFVIYIMFTNLSMLVQLSHIKYKFTAALVKLYYLWPSKVVENI